MLNLLIHSLVYIISADSQLAVSLPTVADITAAVAR